MGNPWGKDKPFTPEEEAANKAYVRLALREHIAEKYPERIDEFERIIPLLANE